MRASGMDLIRCRQWGLAATLPAKTALKKDFADVIIRYFKVAAPVVDALNTPIAAAFVPKKRVLFRPALSWAVVAVEFPRIEGLRQMRRQVRGFQDARSIAGKNPGKNRRNMGISQQKPKKTVEIGRFPIDFARPKPHCNHRQGSS